MTSIPSDNSHEVLAELRKLNEKLSVIEARLKPLEGLAPLIERGATLLDNPATRWAMRKKTS